jgi:hypothetical protein
VPAFQGSLNARTFALTIQGVNYTTLVDVGTVRISDAAEAPATLDFTIFFPQGGTNTVSWLSALSQDIEFKDTANNRRLFKGNLVRARRSHAAGIGIFVDCTCVGYEVWLDRLVLPKWTSFRANGTRITSDREMMESITTAVGATPSGQFAWDATATYVDETNTSMPKVEFLTGGSVRDIMSGVAEAAATVADPTARRFYIDLDNHLHYFKGDEGLAAPYRIGDASYSATVQAHNGGGLVEYWPFREASGTTAYGYRSLANATLDGNYARNSIAIVPNEPQMATTLFGTAGSQTAYATATHASLHPGDTFSVEFWIKRGALSTRQTVWSGGANDVEIGFNVSNQVIVTKEGVGNNFVTDSTVLSTALFTHIVVTRSPGTTKVYINGANQTGTTTARTFVAAAGAINIGRRLSATDQYLFARLSHVAVYANELSAATVLAHYRDGITLVPDVFDHETDINDSGKGVYVKGGNAAGTGWVYRPTNSAYRQTFLIDRPESLSATMRDAIGEGFLKRDANELYGGRAQVTGIALGFLAGQTVHVDHSNLAIDSDFTIRQIDTYPNFGNGTLTYDISFGVLPWSGTFAVQKKKRRR